VADDSALDLLEEYCGSDAARFSGMRALAMHTADSAQGYPKLIKLRPYSTLPDYVEACSKYCEANRQEPLGEVRRYVCRVLGWKATLIYRKALTDRCPQNVQRNVRVATRQKA
jgi:hypothetical protein